MGALDGRPDAVRVQVANVLRAAQKIVGSREALAARLKVTPELVGEWIAKMADAPDDVVHEAVEIILESRGAGRG
jgi:hypothetical protein